MKFSYRDIDRNNIKAFQNYILPDMVQAATETDDGIIMVGAVADGKETCGAAAGVIVDDMVMLYSLFVDEKVRHMGIGTALVHEFLQRAGDRAMIFAMWTLPEKKFEEMSAFMNTCGFGGQYTSCPVYRLEISLMKNVPVLGRAFSPNFRMDANIVPVRDFTEEEAAELLQNSDIEDCLKPDNFEPEELAADICLGYRYGGHIQAYLLCERTGEHDYAILGTAAVEGANPAAFLLLAAAVLHNIYTAAGENANVWLEAINEKAEKLAGSLSRDTCTLWTQGIAVYNTTHTK